MAKVAQKQCHILIIEDLQGRRSISLDNPLYSLGRHCSNSIVVYSKHISRQHATLIQKKQDFPQKSSFFILDGDGKGNQSHNGIFINGKKCLVHELQDGDLINFGGDVNASYHVLSTTNSMSQKIETRHLTYEETTNHDCPRGSAKGERITEIGDRYSQPKQELSVSAMETLNQEDTFLKPSYQDWLTGLSNRILFNEHMAIALANAKEKQEQLAVIYLDLEQFKEINNKFGYPVGDRILKEFAQRMNDCLRTGDIVARWGGDEFTILLRQIKHLDDPMRVSQRILSTLKQPFVVEKQQAHLKCNIGIALYPQNGEDVAKLIKTAALNLETYKQQRLNEQRSLTTANKPPANPQLSRVESILRKALEREELSLHYQPQVNIHTGEIYGMEALLRWHHPKQGTIYPHQFLPWAEKTNLILPISQWVLQSACRQNRAWQIAGLPHLPISVNLSPRQLQQTNLIQMVEGVLAETGLDPHWLEFEVTEKAIVQNANSASQVFHQLSQLGVPIAIDDFGTGYSAIGYLQEFPFHKLKIAQTCVRQLQKTPQKTGIISAAIALGYTFNLRVVAEGVETQQQLDLLRQLHCQEMQGYRFSQPLGGKQATQFLTRHWIIKAQDVAF
jgi:diguanylate cyclase (GGDEF)-like protein